MPNPEATYDSLFTVKRLQDTLHGVTEGEVHLFVYLSALLGLFRGHPIAEWGYRFARTKWGSPFSLEIADAIKELEFGGQIQRCIQNAVTTLVCSNEGQTLLVMLDDLSPSQGHRPYLDAACSSASALPVPAIRQAIRMEPTFKSASGHTGPQELLTGPSVELLYEQFGALREVLADNDSDLLVPSSVWLSYLIEKSLEFKA